MVDCFQVLFLFSLLFDRDPQAHPAHLGREEIQAKP